MKEKQNMVRKRNWGISNPFSEYHRKCLPGNYCLWDIDGVFTDGQESVIGLYEGKFKMDTQDRGNFIEKFYHPSNLQASFLRKMSMNLGIWICEESTDLWWYVDSGDLKESKNPNIIPIKTENRIYVETKINGATHTPLAVFVRTEGEKPCSLEYYADEICYYIESPKVLVNDMHQENSIYLKRNNEIIEIELNESSSHTWIPQWEMLGIS